MHGIGHLCIIARKWKKTAVFLSVCDTCGTEKKQNWILWTGTFRGSVLEKQTPQNFYLVMKLVVVSDDTWTLGIRGIGLYITSRLSRNESVWYYNLVSSELWVGPVLLCPCFSETINLHLCINRKSNTNSLTFVLLQGRLTYASFQQDMQQLHSRTLLEYLNIFGKTLI